MDQRRWSLTLFLLAAVLFAGTAFLRDGKKSEDRRIGAPLPAFSLFDATGAPRPFEDLAAEAYRNGSKRILISLWATWCAPCVKELPELEKRRAAWKARGLEIFLVNYEGGSPQKAAAEVTVWSTKNNLVLTTYFDPKEKLLNELSISALPFSFLVDEKGVVRWIKEGALDFEGDESTLFQDL